MKFAKFLLLAAAAVTAIAQTPTSGASTYLGVWVWQVDTGVEITRVSEGSPADAAGLKAGDVVTHYNGQRIQNLEQFSAVVRDTKAGARIELQVLRNGAPLSVTARIGAVVAPRAPLPFPRSPIIVPDLPRSVTTWRSPVLGMDAEAIEGQLAAAFGVNQGVLVRNVTRDSIAQRAGIRAGDVIVAVGNTKVATPADITLRLREASAGTLVFHLVRDRKEITVTIALDLVSNN